MGSAANSSARSGVKHQPKLNSVHFSLIIRHLVATVLMTFLQIDWPKGCMNEKSVRYCYCSSNIEETLVTASPSPNIGGRINLCDRDRHP